jgi:S-formylglutathione hydrolase FrmB
MKKLILSLLAIPLVFSALAQSPAPPQSKIVTDSIHSKVLNAYRAYNIFLPKSYETDTNKKYPILYLLHGMMDTHQGWAGRGHEEYEYEPRQIPIDESLRPGKE